MILAPCYVCHVLRYPGLPGSGTFTSTNRVVMPPYGTMGDTSFTVCMFFICTVTDFSTAEK